MFGFEFKHLVFMGALFCAGWTLAVSGLVAYEEIGYFQYPSELPQDDSLRIKGFDLNFFDKFKAVSQTMNIVLPIGFGCIAFLLYTYSLNPIGFGSLATAVAALVAALFRGFDACQKVEQLAGQDPNTFIWWMM